MAGRHNIFLSFLGALAKRGSSNSLILLEDKDQGNKTSAFESYAFGNSLNLLDIFWNLLDSFRGHP